MRCVAAIVLQKKKADLTYASPLFRLHPLSCLPQGTCSYVLKIPQNKKAAYAIEFTNYALTCTNS